MRVVCLPLLLCLCLGCAACGQRVNALVRAEAMSAPVSRGQSYVLLPPPLVVEGSPDWQVVRDLLRPRLAALGYVPFVPAVPARMKGAPEAPPEAVASGSSTPGARVAGTARPDGTQGRGTPKHGSGRRVGANASVRAKAVSAAADAPSVVIRVYWDAIGPCQRYVWAPWPPRYRGFGPWYRGVGPWGWDAWYPAGFVPEAYYVRRLLIEAVRNGAIAPDGNASDRTEPGAPELARRPPLSLDEALHESNQAGSGLLWRVLVSSAGDLSRAERVLPEMTRAALPCLGANISAQVRVTADAVQVLQLAP